jgi:hypothetical protein
MEGLTSIGCGKYEAAAADHLAWDSMSVKQA